MAYGTWGSRFPLGNLLFTGLVLFGVQWRFASRRLINWIRAVVFPRSLVRVNNKAAAVDLQHWFGAGYDRLNVGGGPKNLTGFVNIDFVSHPSVEREVRANILDLSFVPSACASQIHSNHVIEHLTREQIVSQLDEYIRILRPGGVLTLRCPNALGVVYAFWFNPVLEAERDAFLALGYPPDEDFGNSQDGWLHKDFYGMLHWLYGDTGNIENQHLSQLTPSWLRELVEEAGFSVLRMSAPEALNLVIAARRPEVGPDCVQSICRPVECL